MANNKTTNPFMFEQNDTTTNQTRRLDFTPVLIDKSNTRASELMQAVANQPELHDLANKMMTSGDPTDLVNLIKSVFDDETIKADAEILTGCDSEQLGRLLESRRSDRSKTKRKGIANDVITCRTYISCMYAELLIRTQTGKPYTGAVYTGSDVDTTDLEAIARRVKSLQSKACRLRKTAQYVQADATELAETQLEIARLNSFKPATQTTSKATPQLSPEQLLEALKKVDLERVSPEQASAIRAILEKNA